MSSLQRLLRDARRDLHVTQEQLARASEGFSHPISREFVANLETAGLPGTVKKFFAYSWLVDADITSLVELCVLANVDYDGETDFATILDRCRAMTDRGEFLPAIGLALTVANAQSDAGKEGESARLTLVGAVAAKRGSLWRMARELAERAYETNHLSPANEVRAVLIIAQSMLSLGRDGLAMSLLSSVDMQLIESDPELSGPYWHDVAIARLTVSDLEGALDAAHQGLASYAQVGKQSCAAMLTSIRAKILSLQNHPGATDVAHAAVRLVDGISDDWAQFHVHLNAGRVLVASGDLDQGEELLDRASRLSEHLPLAGINAFELMATRCELLLVRGKNVRGKEMLRKLRINVNRTAVDKRAQQALERLNRLAADGPKSFK